jgi:chromosome segregation ATPase
MGREAVVTAEQINAAADAMKAEGLKPTSRAIRERLGNVGSFGTINKQLQRWRAGQVQGATPAVSLPPPLQRAILEYLGQELQAAKASLEGELADQQQETADLATENERQADAIQSLHEQLEAMSIAHASAEGKATQLAVDLSMAREEALRERQAAEAARTELAKCLLKLEAMPRLENDLNAVRAELAREREARVSAEQSAAVLAAKKSDADDRLADAIARAERAERQAERCAAELADCRTATQDAVTRAQTFERELASAKTDAERLRGDLIAAKGDAERARLEARTAGEVAAELRGQLSTAQRSLRGKTTG